MFVSVAAPKATQAKGWNKDNDVVHSDDKALRFAGTGVRLSTS